MKKTTLLLIALLSSASMFAVDYLVQTGISGDATWDENVSTTTGASIVNLTENGQSIDTWLNANTGKTIWFAAGTYTFSASYTVGGTTLLYGGFAGTETSIDARAHGTQPWDMTNETVFSGNNSVRIFNGNVQNYTIDGITLANSKHTDHGGLMRMHNNTLLQNCKVMNNTHTKVNGQGGAIQIYNGNCTMRNCYFEGNISTGQGGAIYSNSSAAVTVTGCYFKDNYVTAAGTAANAGGAVHVQGAGIVTIEQCTFTGNHIDNSKNGAALSCANSNTSTTVDNCLFYGNNCNKNAVYFQTGNFFNNTIAENEGGAIYFSGASQVTNCVFWGTTKAKAALSTVDNASSTFSHNASVSFGTYTHATVTNHLLLDSANVGSDESVNYPYFSAPESGDYSLTAKSALINAGTPIATIITDLQNTVRPQGSAYDIGAYEYAGTGTGLVENWQDNHCFGAQNAICMQGLHNGTSVQVYTIAGVLVYKTIATKSELSIPANQGIYLVRVGNETSKVIVK